MSHEKIIVPVSFLPDPCFLNLKAEVDNGEPYTGNTARITNCPYRLEVGFDFPRSWMYGKPDNP
jgi:hypothetical protein